MSKHTKHMEFLKKNQMKAEKLNINALKTFKENLKNLQDTRQYAKCTYKIWDIVTYVFVATLAGQDTWEDIHDFIVAKKEFFKSFLMMTGGIPCAKTIKRVFGSINPANLEYYTTLFYEENLKTKNDSVDIIAIDGKQDRGSGRKPNEIRDKIENLNVLSAYSNNDNFCIGAMMIADKSNEIPSAPKLLQLLNIEGSIVTADALNTQKDTVKEIISGKADYVLALKGNQHTFYNEVVLYFNDIKLDAVVAKNSKVNYHKEIKKEGNRVVTREYFHTEDIAWFEDKDKWNNLKSIVAVRKTTEKYGEVTSEMRYYISSLLTNVTLVKKVVEKHWGIEGKLHYHLDVTFNLDKNTTIDKKALMNLGLVKKLCIPMINKAAKTYGVSSRRVRNILSMDFDNQISLFFNTVIK